MSWLKDSAAKAESLTDNDQIENKPNHIDIILRRVVWNHERKNEFPRDIRAKRRYRHAVRFVTEPQSNDKEINQSPENPRADFQTPGQFRRNLDTQRGQANFGVKQLGGNYQEPQGTCSVLFYGS